MQESSRQESWILYTPLGGCQLQKTDSLYAGSHCLTSAESLRRQLPCWCFFPGCGRRIVETDNWSYAAIDQRTVELGDIFFE